MQKLIGNIKEDARLFDNKLRISENFDLIGREMYIGDRVAKMYFIDAFTKDEIFEKMLEYLTKLEKKDVDKCKSTREFCNRYITYTETDIESDVNTICTQVLSGTLAMIIDGFSEVIMVDCRTYPIRSLEEPDSDRVLRGSHDGFTETLVFNAALIRRRLRDPNLTIKVMSAGKKSHTDIIVCYLDNIVDKKALKIITDKIKNINVNTLAMSQQSLAECIIPKQWYNPFPRIRYTERPDAATATIAEGNVIVMIDNSPSAMIINTSFFDFIQDSNDYYFPSNIGSYLRYVRLLVFFLTMILTPVWYLFIRNPDWIPYWLGFIKIEESVTLPVIAQLLIIELVIDALKLASLNTPNSLSASFSVIGALVLGEFAVNAKWFVAEVVLYMAFVAVANYSQPSFELGYAFKFSRVFLLILTALFNWYGFLAGIVLLIVLLATTKTVTGISYLYPLFPFNKEAMKSLFVRRGIQSSSKQSDN